MPAGSNAGGLLLVTRHLFVALRQTKQSVPFCFRVAGVCPRTSYARQPAVLPSLTTRPGGFKCG